MKDWNADTERKLSALAFKLSYLTIGGLALLLLLSSTAAVFLSPVLIRDKAAPEPVAPPPVQPAPETTAEQAEPVRDESEDDDSTPPPVVQPRSVEEMLNDADLADPADDPPNGLTTGITENGEPHDVEADDDSVDEMMPAMEAETAELVKAARYAQIEGDLKIAVLKLEQAIRLEPENPVVLYYYGLTYEWLRNADKAREYFLKVYTQREKAGKYFSRSAKHLQSGFSCASDLRGDMAFGTILEYRDPDKSSGERVKLTIPILMKDGLNVRPEDLHIRIQFFDLVNGKKVELTRSPDPTFSWVTEPVDWADGEEIMEVSYYMPPLTDEEQIAFGSLTYYGYTAKLYYKGEPMDCHATPPVLFLIEQMKTTPSGSMPELYEGGGLLPPVEASPVSDSYESFLP